MRASVALDIGRITSVDVVPMADDPEKALLVFSGLAGKVTHEVNRADLWTIATSCRNAARLCEMHQMLEKVPA